MYSVKDLDKLANRDRNMCLSLAAEYGQAYPTMERQKNFVSACGEFRYITDAKFKDAVDSLKRGGLDHA